eukprot:CAMPEP_0172533962 /NCGR_PEP_ID=MMETSP1067-20121228/6500_1 /TAXON_ID=265564 ORGANISM="Thalassiosira punctigera, Strain Tpunct2005C2" /NCGR_SAMPLE_ID=MMETSP1067 /ASSEMBLY_ACC=CAM_ASM_000444 /LENGTH=1238 /DNA_ID=CAMNT_0013318687 /DNA_START=199 /DNA_END=3912 /DNA_ORIENTATION=-
MSFELADHPAEQPRQFYVGHGKASYAETTTTTTVATTAAAETASSSALATNPPIGPTVVSAVDDGGHVAGHEGPTTAEATAAEPAATGDTAEATEQASYSEESASNHQYLVTGHKETPTVEAIAGADETGTAAEATNQAFYPANSTPNDQAHPAAATAADDEEASDDHHFEADQVGPTHVTSQVSYPSDFSSGNQAHVAVEPATATAMDTKDDQNSADHHFESDRAEPAQVAEAAQQPKSESQLATASRAIGRANTSYALFSSNPYRFSTDNIHAATHYITDKIEGTIWLDANGDGRRGDYADSELNQMEHDTGIGGVKVQLVDCKTDELVADTAKSQPLGSYGGNPLVKRSVDETAGLYSFPLESVQAGRYYLMYTAPRDYRISGNVLPLERNAPFFDCLPGGGEGDVYLRQARTRGEFDVQGYCARSVGCFEVDDMINEHEKSNLVDYSKLEVLGNNEALSDAMTGGYRMHMGNLVALPSREYFDVGLAEEKWELPTYQYADLDVTVTLPPNLDLEEAVPKDFERSDARRRVEAGLTQFLGERKRGKAEEFDVQGIDLHRGKIEHVSTRRRKMLRGSPDDEWSHIIYTLTARARYRPPPYRQLGSFIEDSINDDPQGVAKSLEDLEALPKVIVEDVNAKWLTIKEIEVTMEIDDGGFMLVGSWAFFLTVGLAAFICVCLLCAGTCLLCRKHAKAKAAAAEAGPQEVNAMSNADIMQELESYGVSTANIVGRQNLVNALIDARFDHIYSRPEPVKKKSVTFSFTTIFSSLSSSGNTNGSNPSQSFWTQSAEAARQDLEKSERMEANKQERMKEAIKSCESLKVGELKTMLKSLGVSASGFVEKKELIRALAEARVDGIEGDATDRATDVDEDNANRFAWNKDQQAKGFSHPSKQQSPLRHHGRARSPGRTGVHRGGMTSPGKTGLRNGASSSPARGGTRNDSDRAKHGDDYQRHQRQSASRGRSPGGNPYVKTSGPAQSARPRSNERNSPYGSARPRSEERYARGHPKTRTRSEEFSGRSRSREGRNEEQHAHKSRSFNEYARASQSRKSEGNGHARPQSEERRGFFEGSCRSEGPRSTKSCPTSAFASAWNEAEYYSKFTPSGMRSNGGDANCANRFARSRSEERRKEARARARPRRRTEEHPGQPWSTNYFQRNADVKPRPKSFHRNEPECTRSFSRSSRGMDGIFDDDYSVGSVSPSNDPPETERPPANGPSWNYPPERDFSSIRADLKAAEPW